MSPRLCNSLKEQWYIDLCKSPATKLSFFLDNMFFNTFELAPYLKELKPEGSLFALWLGGHTLRVETNRWIHPSPPREQRVCCFCHSGDVEDERQLFV